MIVPFGCGSSAAPVMSIFACTVPFTSISAVVSPCTSPRSIGVLLTWRSKASSPDAAVRWSSVCAAAALNAATGRSPSLPPSSPATAAASRRWSDLSRHSPRCRQASRSEPDGTRPPSTLNFPATRGSAVVPVMSADPLRVPDSIGSRSMRASTVARFMSRALTVSLLSGRPNVPRPQSPSCR